MAGNPTAKSPPRKREPAKAEFDKAREFEATIAREGALLRTGADTLTPALFHQLYDLACMPIPKGFIVEVSRGDGKPYDSKGIRSVQVQIARMNAVFTPLWWDLDTTYHEDGKLCEVTVAVHVEGRTVQRSAWGGVDRANTLGNLRKGAFTNAAKLAFARFGVGGEVYMGAADFDPDVNPDAAREQAKGDRPAAGRQVEQTAEPIGQTKAAELVDVAWALGLKDKLQLAASHVVGDDVGDCSNKTAATKALTDLTRVQAAKVETWLNKKADQMAAAEEHVPPPTASENRSVGAHIADVEAGS